MKVLFKSISNCRGISAVEAAIIIPLMLFLLASAVSFSQIFYSRLMINDALRAAGRAAVMAPVKKLANPDAPDCKDAANAAFSQLMAQAAIPVGAAPIMLYREASPAQAVGAPPVLGIQIQSNDVSITCVLCPLLRLGGVSYRPSTSQFVPFESNIYNCWDELPDLP